MLFDLPKERVDPVHNPVVGNRKSWHPEFLGPLNEPWYTASTIEL